MLCGLALAASPAAAIEPPAAPVAALPVPARDIARGEILAEGDLRWDEIATVRTGTYIDDADLIIGQSARRPLAAGAPLRKSDLAAPILIKRGAAATVVLEAPGIRLSQAAAALQSGAHGDLIAFRNLNSGREFKAVVVAKDLARAPFRTGALLAAAEAPQ
jgi:flagella basal body P-ring formation protein FlgA